MFCRAAARRSCCCIALLLAALLPRTVLAQQFSEAELDAFAEEVRRDGFTLIPSVLPPAKLRAMRAAFRPVLAKQSAYLLGFEQVFNMFLITVE